MTKGFAHDDLLFESALPQVRLAGTRFSCQYPILYEKEIVLGFEAPEEPRAPIRLQSALRDPHGHLLLCIVDNEWRVGAENHDIVTTKNRLTITGAGQKSLLEMEHSSDSGLWIRKLLMSTYGNLVILRGDNLAVATRNGSVFNFTRGCVKGEAGVVFGKDGGIAFAEGNLPFLDKAVQDFNARNRVEKLMTLCKDGPEQWRSFSEELMRSQVFVFMDAEKTLGCLTDTGWPRFVIAMTAHERIDRVASRYPSAGTPLQIPFRTLLATRDPRAGIVLNPLFPVSLHFSCDVINCLP
jgi:hypothetical protein